MIIVNSYSDIRPFQFIESATIEVESLKTFIHARMAAHSAQAVRFD